MSKIDMRDISCDSLLSSNDPSAVVLSILCDFEGRDKQIVVNTILRKLKELSDDREYSNYLKMVNILSTNRNLVNEVKKGVNMLSVDMKKTPFYQLGEERGEERGEKRGEKRGALQMAATMIEEFNLSVDTVAKKLDISLDELKNFLHK